MLERLKKHSLVRLSVSIAAGCVIAHFAIQLCDYIYDYFIRDNQDLVVAWIVTIAVFGCICTGIFFLVRWLRRDSWEVGGRGWLLFLIASALVAKLACTPILVWLFPPESYIAVAGYDGREYAARLAANRAMIIYAVLYVFFLLAFLSAGKLIWVMRERRRKQRILV